MDKTLTREQVKKLFAYCRKNEIYEYDLQIEMVDHLASSIEDQWRTNPELSFGWALKNSLQKFGRYGLQKMERKMKKQLKHKFHHILWCYFLEYFKLPKIIITTLLFLLIFTVLRVVQNNFSVILTISVIIGIAGLYYAFYFFPKKFEMQTEENKKFIVLDYLKEVGAKAGIFIQLPLFISMASDEMMFRYSNSFWEEISISVFFAFLVVLLYGYFYFLPLKIKQFFIKHYSEIAS